MHHAFCTFRSPSLLDCNIKRPNFTHRLYGVKFQKISRRSKTLDPSGSLRLRRSFRKSVSIYPIFARGCHPEILILWHRGVTTFPLYSFATFARWNFFAFFALRKKIPTGKCFTFMLKIVLSYGIGLTKTQTCRKFSPVTYIFLYIASVSLVKSDRKPISLSQPQHMFLPSFLACSLSYHKGTLCLSRRMNRNKRFLNGC